MDTVLTACSQFPIGGSFSGSVFPFEFGISTFLTAKRYMVSFLTPRKKILAKTRLEMKRFRLLIAFALLLCASMWAQDETLNPTSYSFQEVNYPP